MVHGYFQFVAAPIPILSIQLPLLLLYAGQGDSPSSPIPGPPAPLLSCAARRALPGVPGVPPPLLLRTPEELSSSGGVKTLIPYNLGL
ncbi:hypothetical protein Y1Q_0023112 [Alligator mississippiensis]|uniref:Uncharacterized protein n=1 Tax=Alligator mississippiensis TaxID=8496 RepID=A0A151P6I0_ALLMI|nr:hypothetical protein Y1Q_0023112 [Alligator mississippiensis]